MINMIFRDFGWFLLKDNILANYLYYRSYKSLIKTKKTRISAIKSAKLTKIHPAYDNFDFKKETSKKFVTDHAEDFKTNSGICFKGYTSGTSNTPLKVYRSISSVIYDELSLRSHWYSTGSGFNPKIATIIGTDLFPGDYKGSKYWKVMPFTSRLIMSCFHLNRDTVESYLKALNIHKPDIILAYPSVIITLAKLALELNWSPTWHIKGVFTSGENFSSHELREVKKVFPRTFDYYGQAERVSSLQQCEEGKYHFVEWYSKIELIEDKSGLKKILGTNFLNTSMPLYRYDTGDLVEDKNCNIPCKCGNNSRYVNEVHGRKGIELSLSNGTKISASALSRLFYGIENVAEGQIYQRLDKSIEIKYSSLSGQPDEAVQRILLMNCYHRLGTSIKIEVKYYSKIPRANSGKLLPIIIENP